jgi:copper(I)-binding protein
MTSFKSALVAIAFIATGSATMAQPSLTDLSFQDPWIRGSVPGQKNGAGYLVIDNKGAQSGALVSANSDRADRIELHTIERQDGVAKMREVTEIPVPAKGSVSLQPGGYHVMFIGLKQPFKAGESIPVLLNFADGLSTEVTFNVMPPTYMGSGNDNMQGHGHGHGTMKGH